MGKNLLLFILIMILSACQSSPKATPPPTPIPPAPLPTSSEVLVSPAVEPESGPNVFIEKIGEHTLSMTCEGSGKPLILLENGLDTLTWDRAKFSNISQTCFYRRVGMNSETPKEMRTTVDQVKELHAFLQKTHLTGPYILVSHSIAGYNLLLFTEQYPDEVVGLVCVDCRHPLVETFFMEKVQKEYAAQPNYEEYRKEIVRKYFLHSYDPEILKGNFERLDLFTSSQQVMKIKTVKDRPFVVLVAPAHPFTKIVDSNKEKNERLFQEAWEMASLSLSEMSTRGRMEIVPNTLHGNLSLHDAVARAIQEVYDQLIRK